MNILVDALEKIADPDKHIGLNIHKNILQDIAKKALEEYRNTQDDRTEPIPGNIKSKSWFETEEERREQKRWKS